MPSSPADSEPDGSVCRPFAVVDIDGVLADVRHRLHHLDRRPKDWDRFFAAAVHDPVLPEGRAVAATLAADHDVVLLTGRPERCRPDTQRWLDTHGIVHERLVMRGDRDHRHAADLKIEHLRTLATQRTVSLIVDDDPHVIAAAQAAGFAAFAATWMERSESLAVAQDEEGRT